MCGIAGYIGKKKIDLPQYKINKILSKMSIRGPDGSNVYQDRIKHFNFSFFQSRLSIIDPNPRSNQPMFDENGVLVFNGMIYNFKEIKNHLKKKKIKFNTSSDTEVLLKFLNLYGEKKLDILDGMWSFAYYNFKNKKFIISRDRFGEKPFYFFKTQKSFYFGSNIDYIFDICNKTFKVDLKKIENYLKFGFRSLYNTNDNSSLFKNINSLKPGTFLTIDKNLNFLEKNYWSPTKIKIKNNLNYKKEVKKLKKSYHDVIRQRNISDFPVACLLSGGVDSSSIVSLTAKSLKKKLHCFSIKTNDKDYDESYLIKKTINKYKCKHTYVDSLRNNERNLSIIKDIINKTSNLVPTTSWLMYSYLIKKIKKLGYKVVLSGTGGDEMFAGYYSHHLHFLKSIFSNKKLFKQRYNQWQKLVVPFVRTQNLKDFNKYLRDVNQIDPSKTEYMHMYKYFNFFKKEKNIKIKFFKDFLKNELYKELIYSSLPPQIAATDNISMYHGVEVRCPILSNKLFELSFSYPSKFLINKGFNKAIFRDSLRGVVDNEILSKREKIGFFIRIDKFFNFKDKKFKKFLFSNKYINSIIDVKNVRSILNKKNKNNQECHLLFGIINSIFFLNKYAKNQLK